MEAHRRVDEKITNRHINNEKYEKQKRRLKVNLAAIPRNLKALFAYSKYIRTSDEVRMTAEVLVKSYMPIVKYGTPILLIK
jgi:hypothetical protein